MGSPLYARLLEVATLDLEADGPIHAVVDHWDGNPMEDAVPLRLLAGVHRLVLSGRAPNLARHYPSAGGDPAWPECGDAFLATVASHTAELRNDMRHPPQTNEVGRAGVLVGGLLEVMRLNEGRPIRLLEFGASAGLNLLLDHYRYDLGGPIWGDPASPVLIRTPWRGATPDLGQSLYISRRRGCDAMPIDVSDEGHTVRLLSFIWPDQSERFERTRAAIAVARAVPVSVDAAGAARWLAGELDAPVPGHVTVVMHSTVMQYLAKDLRGRIDQLIARHGKRASHGAPLARLSLEPGQQNFALALDLWPHDVHVLLADAHPHGAWAEWFIGTTPR